MVIPVVIVAAGASLAHLFVGETLGLAPVMVVTSRTVLADHSKGRPPVNIRGERFKICFGRAIKLSLDLK